MAGHHFGALFERVIVPIASEEDATRANETILPYIHDVGGTPILVHVVKKTEGGIDPSPIDLQEEEAERLFDIARRGSGDDVETRTAYGSEIGESILETARKTEASAIVFSPREKSLLMRLLAGDTARSLMTNEEIPVLALPHRDG